MGEVGQTECDACKTPAERGSKDGSEPESRPAGPIEGSMLDRGRLRSPLGPWRRDAGIDP